MVEAFKTINPKNGSMETIYAVFPSKEGESLKKEDIYREVASYRKGSLSKTKARFKKLCPGYIINNKGMLELYYGGTNRKGAKACITVRH